MRQAARFGPTFLLLPKPGPFSLFRGIRHKCGIWRCYIKSHTFTFSEVHEAFPFVEKNESMSDPVPGWRATRRSWVDVQGPATGRASQRFQERSRFYVDIAPAVPEDYQFGTRSAVPKD